MPRKKIKFSDLTVEDSYYYLCCLHELGINPFARELFLTGEPALAVGPAPDEPGVEYTMATRFIKNLRALQLESSKPILIHMKTCGGYETEGNAIYDAVRFCPCHVTILNYTHARSMSSIILQAADNRVMMPFSYFMFHWGTLELFGNYQAIMSDIEFSKQREANFLNVYVDSMKQKGKFRKHKRERISEVLRDAMNQKTDVFLTPEDTVDWGLADSVFDGDWKALK